MARVLLLNGPNLNLLGMREPAVYGTDTLESIEKRSATLAAELGHELITFQSNAEHELIERVHKAKSEGVAFGIVNPGAFTHTSIALRDALLGTGCPSSRCTCPTRTRARRFGGTRISPTSPQESCAAWAHSATRRRCAPWRSASPAAPEGTRQHFQCSWGQAGKWTSEKSRN